MQILANRLSLSIPWSTTKRVLQLWQWPSHLSKKFRSRKSGRNFWTNTIIFIMFDSNSILKIKKIFLNFWPQVRERLRISIVLCQKMEVFSRKVKFLANQNIKQFLILNTMILALLIKHFGWEISAIWVILVNPRRYNSASTLSGCIKRSKSKVILALPTCLNIIQFFEKTLIGGFSSVNMRAAFETEIILLNLSVKDMNKLNIDQSFGNRLEAATR